MENTKYYISCGEGVKMYTLRVEWEEKYNGEKYTRSNHIRNLSIDLAKAIAKAISLGYDIAFVNSPELNPITYKTAEELEAEKNAEVNREKAIWEDYVRGGNDAIKDTADGFWGLGKHKGKKISYDDHPDYIKWWLFRDITTDSDSMKEKRNCEVYIAIRTIIREMFVEEYAILLKAEGVKKGNGKYYGEIKTRYKKVPVTHLSGFVFDGFYGSVYLETFVTETGEILIYKGGTVLPCSEGEKYVIDFTVKAHDLYKGINQTSILRVKFEPPTKDKIKKIISKAFDKFDNKDAYIALNLLDEKVKHISLDDFYDEMRDIIYEDANVERAEGLSEVIEYIYDNCNWR